MERPEPSAGVVEDAVEDHPHPAGVGGVEQLPECGVAAEQGVHAHVVIRVVAVVRCGTEDRVQVERRDPQVGRARQGVR